LTLIWDRETLYSRLYRHAPWLFLGSFQKDLGRIQCALDRSFFHSIFAYRVTRYKRHLNV
jgi:hypothetical protein